MESEHREEPAMNSEKVKDEVEAAETDRVEKAEKDQMEEDEKKYEAMPESKPQGPIKKVNPIILKKPIRKVQVTSKKKEPEKSPHHRFCPICNLMIQNEKITLLATIPDRLFVLLTFTYRKILSFEQARNYYKCHHPYSCKSHYSEASFELLKMLAVTSPMALSRAKMGRVILLQSHVEALTGMLIEPKNLIYLVHEFTVRYPRLRVSNMMNYPLVVSEKDIPVQETVEYPMTEESEIVPKSRRPPRKQVLEKENSDDSILRVIKRTEFRPRTYQARCGSSADDPLTCCFCLEPRLKCNLLKVPKSRDRKAQWAHKLGEDFAARVRDDCKDYYLCRNHFAKEAFSVKGRLLKGCAPNVLTPPKVLLYKINGDDLVKLGECKDAK